jgi:hypothetical protein
MGMMIKEQTPLVEMTEAQHLEAAQNIVALAPPKEIAKILAQWMYCAAKAEREVAFRQEIIDDCACELGEEIPVTSRRRMKRIPQLVRALSYKCENMKNTMGSYR